MKHKEFLDQYRIHPKARKASSVLTILGAVLLAFSLLLMLVGRTGHELNLLVASIFLGGISSNLLIVGMILSIASKDSYEASNEFMGQSIHMIQKGYSAKGAKWTYGTTVLQPEQILYENLPGSVLTMFHGITCKYFLRASLPIMANGSTHTLTYLSPVGAIRPVVLYDNTIICDAYRIILPDALPTVEETAPAKKPLITEEMTTIFCPSCGRQIDITQKVRRFCPFCGYDISTLRG